MSRGARTVGGELSDRARGIIRVARIALARFDASHRNPPVARELRRLLAEAERDPSKVERVRAELVSTPELKQLLEIECPEAINPLPFRPRTAMC
jgi:hypothetical protein